MVGTSSNFDAERWFQRFNARGLDLKDNPRSERPTELNTLIYNYEKIDQLRWERRRQVDREAGIEATEEDSTLTTQKLATDFDCDHATGSRILKSAHGDVFNNRLALTPRRIRTKCIIAADGCLKVKRMQTFLKHLENSE
ncbi:hypothetical protein KIN20_027296 [Parelaphostrongylus tenuis]|uniref:Mos1 transposase HTH domain-containing protein n=1 Tax=Parelaphostrongylus tenuis TaxID=148309 RepID=A0AAD5WDS2_PARTN|nr:hypothetical protein KIN20_027296 [Parelaphostrongylus tenuis]